jgi:hypothetical protein
LPAAKSLPKNRQSLYGWLRNRAYLEIEFDLDGLRLQESQSVRSRTECQQRNYRCELSNEHVTVAPP